MKKLINEFKDFISRGNVLDLAVGVIIGEAFGKIVSSLVNDVIMPIIGMILGGLDFSNLKITIKDASISYGLFIQNIIDFLIVAACIFMVMKIINKIHKKKQKNIENVKSEKSNEEKILEEIRDLLKKDK